MTSRPFQVEVLLSASGERGKVCFNESGRPPRPSIMQLQIFAAHFALALVAALGAVLPLFSQTKTCKPFDFDLPANFDAGPNATTIVVADMDADGIDDLVTGNTRNQSVSVMLGTGRGSFGPPQSFAAGVDVDMIDIRDVNGDGKPDLTAGKFGDFSKIMLLLNDGNAGFGTPQVVATLPIHRALTKLRIYDVNGDQAADIIAATSETLTVFAGDNQGDFDAGHSVSWNSYQGKIAIGDVNNDGSNDVVVSGSHGPIGLPAIAIIAGNPNNNFSITEIHQLEARPAGIVIGLLNGDSAPDIAIAANDDNFPYLAERFHVQAWMGAGTGAFSPGPRVPLPALVTGLEVTDYNLDGKLDLVADMSSFVAQVAGLGDGNFGSSAFWRSNGSVAIATLDTDQDGREDIAALRGMAPSQGYGWVPEPSLVSVLRTNPDGTLSQPKPVFDGGTHIVAADMNSDGFNDLITARMPEPNQTTRVVLAMNDGSGGFLPDVWAGASYSLSSLELANINNDGQPDLFTTHGGFVAGYLGNGAGGLIPMSIPPLSGSVNQVSGVIPADFDNDGKQDAIFGQWDGWRVRLGNGDGTYRNPNHPPIIFSRPLSGDFNNDGKVDLVGYDYPGGGWLRFYLGNGDGTFTQGSSIQTVGFYGAVGDFDGDGNLDVAGVASIAGVTTVYKFFGDGNGNLAPPATFSVQGVARSLISADFNSDSLDDLAFVASTPARNLVVISSTSQAPYYGHMREFSVGGLAVSWIDEPKLLVGADYNNDGKVDIGYTERDVSRGVLINISSSTTPCMSINDVTVNETEAVQTAVFTVTLSQPTSATVSVNYAVRPRTASLPSDLQNIFGRLEIPAGETSASITVPVAGDLLDETDEEYTVELTSVVNAFLVDGAALGKIIDNDAEPTLSVEDLEYQESNAAGQAPVVVRLSAPSGKPVSFRYSTVNGTAVNNQDYTHVSVVKTIDPGLPSTTLPIRVFNDSMHEPTETFRIDLSESSNAAIADAEGTVTVIDNDPVPTFTISAGNVTEPDTGFFVNRSVTLTLSNPTYLPVTGSTQSTNGTATAGADYVEFAAPFTFVPGQTQLVGQVRILGDTLDERNETLFMNVSSVENAGVGATQAQITIVDDEPTGFDYDGDSRSDLSIRRPSDNIWHLLRGTAGYTAMQWGIAGDRMAPADYDGDQKTDVAVFRPSEGKWYIHMSQSQTFQVINWGMAGDLPLPADRDGDRRADLIIFRPAENMWYIRMMSNGGQSVTAFGEAGDKPVSGDFDGDGRADIAVYRPSNSNWYIIKSGVGYFIQTWGAPGDLPVTGDFDGDGKTDQAIFRPNTGEWYLSQTTAGFSSLTWGQASDIPVPADYDGDGKTDVAIFRPSESNWYIVQSTAGILIQNYGQVGDIPTQSSFAF